MLPKLRIVRHDEIPPDALAQAIVDLARRVRQAEADDDLVAAVALVRAAQVLAQARKSAA